MNYVEGNVLDDYPFKADVTVAFNFSYFIFKTRKQLVEYFKKVREGLKDDGVFFLDLFLVVRMPTKNLSRKQSTIALVIFGIVTNTIQSLMNVSTIFISRRMEKDLKRYFPMIGECGQYQSFVKF